MRKRTVVLMFAVMLDAALPAVTLAQDAATPPGWKICPNCMNDQRVFEGEKKLVPGHPFNPRDFSGVWGVDLKSGQGRWGEQNMFSGGISKKGLKPTINAGGDTPPPPFTPYGKQRYDATRTDKAPDGTDLPNTKDPMLICDPMGFPRVLTNSYGFEFITLPDRVLQVFEWGHTLRTIWTDGRKLPDNPPQPRYMGWAVGHWEGDTLIVESNGYDDRSWLNMDLPDFTNGWPHSDEMRIEERWKRLDYGTLEAQLTVIDPKIYTKPWATEVHHIKLRPDAELWEYFCVPSDFNDYNEKVLERSSSAQRVGPSK